MSVTLCCNIFIQGQSFSFNSRSRNDLTFFLVVIRVREMTSLFFWDKIRDRELTSVIFGAIDSRAQNGPINLYFSKEKTAVAKWPRLIFWIKIAIAKRPHFFFEKKIAIAKWPRFFSDKNRESELRGKNPLYFIRERETRIIKVL